MAELFRRESVGSILDFTADFTTSINASMTYGEELVRQVGCQAHTEKIMNRVSHSHHPLLP